MLPTCLPYFFTGLKTAAPMAITASILVGHAQGGVRDSGCLLSQSLKHNTIDIRVLGDSVISAALGILVTKLMGLMESLLNSRMRAGKKGK